VKSAWSDSAARAAVDRYTRGNATWCNEDLALRTYSARLIGAEPALVLYGGGNTSVKTRLRDDTGEEIDVICVKGSGWDLATIEPAGQPAVRLSSLAALRRLEALSDEDMVRAARSRLLDPAAPTPSVELLLHAFLPHRYIDHSHADAILALVDQDDAEWICREVYGDRLHLVPYIMPGFALAKLAAEVYERDPGVEGLLLHRHGLFTFGDTARESYERHIAAVTAAEDHLAARRLGGGKAVAPVGRQAVAYARLAPHLRGALASGGNRYILHCRTDAAIRAFVDGGALESLARRGPATPDHVLRTKPLPLILRLDGVSVTGDRELRAAIDEAVGAYRDAYDRYFVRQATAKGVTRTRLDPDPRIVLVPGLGLIAAGSTAADARAAAELYAHTMGIIRDAEAAGCYAPVSESDIFDLEYWSLEQAKLAGRKRRALESRIVYITGAASGIGAAVARRFAAAGAHLFLVDRDESVAEIAGELDAGHAIFDITERTEVEASMAAAVERFGGLDGVVSNAGVAVQARIHECTPDELERSLSINFFSHQWVAAAATRVLRTQGTGGFLLFNVSKAPQDPGPGLGPYVVAKAALFALMRQYALEQGEAGIRAAAVNADRVRTRLLSEEAVHSRARARGISVDDYYRTNLLHREVTAEDVAEAFLHLALAESSTGLAVTVDGGNMAAAPR
jgi:rhamnose utilization protein RhaD (predicted bifunctional aldolase and dehydrogenase)/NAD(P)-dependent dehydrogenase (short-subunit alcohol dehydrogenase family)